LVDELSLGGGREKNKNPEPIKAFARTSCAAPPGPTPLPRPSHGRARTRVAPRPDSCWRLLSDTAVALEGWLSPGEQETARAVRRSGKSRRLGVVHASINSCCMPFLLLRIPARVSTDRETPRCLREPPADHPVDQRPRSVQL